MRVLLVAPDSSFTDGVSTALTAEGHTVTFFNDRLDYALPVPLRSLRFLWRLGRRIPKWRRHSNAALQRALLDAVTRNQSELLLATKGMNIKRPTFEALRSGNVKTTVWFPDNAANEPYSTWVRSYGPLWDYFFSFDSAIRGQVPSAMLARTHVLPFGIDPGAWDTPGISDAEREEFSSDVCFIGAPYPDRVALLEHVSDLDLKIWGWSGWRNTSLRRFYRGPLDASGSAKAYRLAKICVNTNIHPMADGVNLKTFEIAAAGGFQLTDHPKDLDASFTVGTEVDVFTDADDFRRRVDYWLTQERGRELIAAAARERVLREHTLRRRVRALIEIIQTA